MSPSTSHLGQRSVDRSIYIYVEMEIFGARFEVPIMNYFVSITAFPNLSLDVL